jgi:Lipase (class 3)
LAPVTSQMTLQPVSNGADDARIAHFEREENFRWIANVLATTSSVTLKERVPEHIQQAIYSFAEFAEIAHGSFDPVFILNDVNRRILGATGFPLEHYPTLTGEIDGQLEHLMLTQRFQGLRGSLQGYCCLRMHPRTPVYDANLVMNESSKHVTTCTIISNEPCHIGTIRPQIVLAFSGTSNARLVLYDIMATPTAYKSAFNYPSKPSWRVHDGFQRVYQGIKSPAFKSLRDAITAMEERTSGPWDLIITAHSLGAAVGYLTLLDLLHHAQDPDTLDSEVPILPNETNITICVFGSPRVANASLVDYFRQLINEWRQERGRAEALTEWSIIGHRDGT